MKISGLCNNIHGMGTPRTKFRACKRCGADIPPSVLIDGKRHKLHPRKYCLTCSPFNDGGPHVRREELDPEALVACAGCEREFPAKTYRFNKTRDGFNK